MKKKVLLLSVLLVFLMAGLAFATNSRVESMGKHDTFFMDDISIFWNPANINIYPNFLTGELGVYRTVPQDTAGGQSSKRYNRDPENPIFGGIYSHSLRQDQNKASESMYPMVSVGVVLNRKDKLIDALKVASLQIDSVDMNTGDPHISMAIDPLVNADVLVGYTFAKGGMIGLHAYIAHQDSGRLNSPKISKVYKGDIGCNWPISGNMDLEAVLGIANLSYQIPGLRPQDEKDYSYTVRARMFSSLQKINGEIVPVVEYENINIRDYNHTAVGLGVGFNVAVDRGFFWLGAKASKLTTTDSLHTLSTNSAVYKKEEKVVVPLSFGIERNIIWDWFVIRVGCQKSIGVVDAIDGAIESKRVEVNAEGDGTINDHVGFGVGLNIEERLKFDITVAEDFPFTLGNLFSGQMHHILTRISATYSF